MLMKLKIKKILSTFYEQLLCQYSFDKKLQSQTVTKEKASKSTFAEKKARVKC